MRVYVYWNLHKHLFSVKNTRTGLVEMHSQEVTLFNPTFAVSQAGRSRVLRERCKNVHAGVRGEMSMAPVGERSVQGWTRVTYNPYKYDSFVRASDECPVEGAAEVQMRIEEGRARVYARGLRFKEMAKAS